MLREPRACVLLGGLSLLSLTACGGGDGAADDAGVDSAVDTGTDSGADAALPPTSTLFGPCATDAECPGRGAICRTNVDGYPNGMCTVPCEDRTPCDVFGAYHHCLPQADGSGSFCEPRCVNGVDCGRDAYTCVGEYPPSGGLCVGICATDAECGEGAECDPYTGRCGPVGSASTSGGEIGDPCTDDADCRSDRCVTEADSPAYVGGYCIGFCILPVGYNTNDIYFEDTLPRSGCQGDSICFIYDNYARGDLGLCLPECTSDADCREGYECKKSFELETGVRTFTNGFCEPIAT